MTPPAPDARRRQTVANAVPRWREQAADVGGRNSLLWFRELPSGTFDLTTAHPGGVAKLLAGRVTLLSELVRERVALAEAKRRVAAIRTKTVELEREHGVTTCFIAVGIASWQLRRAPVPPRAPVLLRECTVRPTDGSHRDLTLQLHDDVVLNPVLAHYLRGEAELEVDDAALAALSRAGEGFDPRPTYRAVEELCGDRLPEFRIGPQMMVSTFPWFKLPFVGELAGEVAGWGDNPLLVALAEGEQSQLDGDSAPHQAAADTEEPAAGAAPARELDLPLDLDRHQQQVVTALRHGRSVVLDAPPGTGRTQTVAAAVADALADGRSVLVAAEHRPALSDLRARLDTLGLADAVLALGETPAASRSVLRELLAAAEQEDVAEPPRPDRIARAEAEAERTDCLARLAEHDAAMHRNRAPFAASLATAEAELTRLARRRPPPVSHVRLTGAALEQLAGSGRGQVTEALVEAAATGAWERGRSEDPWYGARLTTPEEAERAGQVVGRMVAGELTEAREAVDAACRAVGLPAPVSLAQWQQRLELLGRVAETVDTFRPEIYEAPLDELVAALSREEARAQQLERPSAMARARARRQLRQLLRPGSPPTDLVERVRAARAEREDWEGLAGRAARPAVPEEWERAEELHQPVARDLAWLADVLAGTPSGRELQTTHLDLLLERLLRLDARVDRLPAAAGAGALLHPLRDTGLGALVDDLARRGIPAEQVPAEVDFVYWASLLDRFRAEDGREHDGAALRGAEVTYRARDRQLRELAGEELRARVARTRAEALAGPTAAAQRRRWHELDRAVAPPTTREIVHAGAGLARGIRPVWLSSPLAVPSVLPEGELVDLVVLEAAGSTPAAHVAPVLARARQLLVVGDSQAVPAHTFSTVVDERAEHGEGTAPGATPLEALGRQLPVHRLGTRYRVLDQRLVRPWEEAVRRYPVSSVPSVLRTPRVVHRVAAGVEEVVSGTVDAVIEHARGMPWQSLAVLSPDPAMVEDLSRALRARIEMLSLGRSFREDAAEALLVSSTAHLAGEARDRVLLALAPVEPVDPREIAAAVETARRQLSIVSDREVEQWPADAGLDLLARALGQQEPVVTGSSCPLLSDLATRLRLEGLTVHEGWGEGPRRVELAVEDPDTPGRPVVAVLSDAAPADLSRDGIRLHPEQLRSRGWTPVRLWCTDLFSDPAREVARVVQHVREAAQARGRR
ncbi:DUF4011 domain-containing protein [Ornithinicoccus halotolerans]|uniref:DUF4011 domain-containing protein n=1 Tax=Ornithinicoccus halotolerans TaxID=1748220 RepID=UPI001294C979|nr:DUF4011 domain-containing protein [Ornithinicoccus halotolerans]